MAWWAFARGRANAAIAHELGSRLDARATSDNFAVRFAPGQPLDRVEREVHRLADADPRSLGVPVRESARNELKFADCLPAELADRAIRERLDDPAAVADAFERTLRIVSSDRA